MNVIFFGQLKILSAYILGYAKHFKMKINKIIIIKNYAKTNRTLEIHWL
jgi:CO dehydrogenase/acetyl-CoA synthase epsilon subunit